MKKACAHCDSGPQSKDLRSRAEWRDQNANGDTMLWWCMGCGKWWCASCAGTTESPICDECWCLRCEDTIPVIRVRGRRVADIRLNARGLLVADLGIWNRSSGRTIRLRRLPRIAVRFEHQFDTGGSTGSR